MGTWTSVVRKETVDRAKRARELRKRGLSISQIAKLIKRSNSRVREYLKGKRGENWNSSK